MNFKAILIAAAMAAPVAVHAQDYQAMIDHQLELGRQQQQQMQEMQGNIVQQNMRNPTVQAGWQRHRAQGGQLTLEQYAYQWAATGGFSPQGMAIYRQNEAANQAREAAAAADLRRAQGERGQAQSAWANGYYANQGEAGRNMQGVATYYDPSNGQTAALPYIPAGAAYADPNTGRQYSRDPQGNYYSQDPYGRWVMMQPNGR